jgi:hypothetical protein
LLHVSYRVVARAKNDVKGQLRKQLPVASQSLPLIVNYADAAWNGAPFV